MPGDEVVVVERMDERPGDAGIGAVLERLPGHRVRDEYELRPQRPHAVELRRGRRLDRDDGAGHARGARGVGDSLTGIPGADRPDAAPPVGVG